jgi:hypothetical protein
MLAQVLLPPLGTPTSEPGKAKSLDCGVPSARKLLLDQGDPTPWGTVERRRASLDGRKRAPIVTAMDCVGGSILWNFTYLCWNLTHMEMLVHAAAKMDPFFAAIDT